MLKNHIFVNLIMQSPYSLIIQLHSILLLMNSINSSSESLQKNVPSSSWRRMLRVLQIWLLKNESFKRNTEQFRMITLWKIYPHSSVFRMHCMLGTSDLDRDRQNHRTAMRLAVQIVLEAALDDIFDRGILALLCALKPLRFVRNQLGRFRNQLLRVPHIDKAPRNDLDRCTKPSGLSVHRNNGKHQAILA